MLSAAAGVAAAAAPATDALGQSLPTVTPGVEPIPGQRYGVPPGALPPAGPAAMNAALPPGMRPPQGPGPGLLPDSLRPYPRISPYDHKFDQTFHDGNLWKRTANNSPRRYFGSASYLQGKFKPANRTHIGSRRSIDQVIEEVFTPNVFGDGFNRSTLSVDTVQTVGGLVQVPWVKSVLIPDGTDFQFFGLAIIQELEPDNTGLIANRPRLATFYDDDVTGALGLPVAATAGDDPDAVVFDAFGFTPLTGGVFSDSGEARSLIPNYDQLIGTRYEDADHPGVRLRFGWEDADGGGFEWSADYLSEQADVYSRGDAEAARRYFSDLTTFDAFDGPPGSVPTANRRPVFNNQVSSLGAIVVDTDPNLLNAALFGTPIARPQPGLFVPDPSIAVFTYDLLYENEFSSEQAGTEFSYVFTPMVQKGRLRLRPSAGLRFNYVQENFRFRGLDSGSVFVTDVFGESSGAEDATAPVIRPGDGAQVINPFFPGTALTDLFPYQSDLTNQVKSYLFGPQFGLHADVDGKFLSLRGHVKAGVAALREEITVEGQGFNLNQHVTGELMPFADRATHSRLSPFVDANIRGELNVFPYIPVINRVGLLKNARFTGGVGITSFWEISRPLDAVVWREANSGNPYVNDSSDDRDQLYFSNWDVGVTWRY